MTTSDLISIISALIALGAVIVAWRKIGPETTQANAAAAKGFMEAAQIAAGQVVDTQKELIEWKQRVERLEAALEIKDRRIDELEAAGREKDFKIKALQCEVNELREKISQLEEKR